MKRHSLPFALVTPVILLMASTVSQAQAQRPVGVASLGEMGCQTTGGIGGYDEGYNVVSTDTTIGRQIYRAVAFLGNSNFGQNYFGIYRNRPTQVVCGLAPATASSQFRSLTLSFGLSQTSDLLDGSVLVRLSVYKDGNFYGEQTIGGGEVVRWPIDVQGTRSLALETECVRAKQGEDACPNIWFIEDVLRR
jgi:hypothetical protein